MNLEEDDEIDEVTDIDDVTELDLAPMRQRTTSYMSSSSETSGGMTPRGVRSPPRTPVTPRGLPTRTARPLIFNQNESSCEWPISLGGMNAKPCEFDDFTQLNMFQPETWDELQLFAADPEKIIDIAGLNELIDKAKLVFGIIKAGVLLLHSTLTPRQHQQWWRQANPSGALRRKKMVWFVTSETHANNIEGSHLLYYKTKRPLLCLFERNIAKKYGNKRPDYAGNTFSVDIFPRIQYALREKANLLLDGYVGCNECEVGLLNKTSQDALVLEHVKEMSMAYIN